MILMCMLGKGFTNKHSKLMLNRRSTNTIDTSSGFLPEQNFAGNRKGGGGGGVVLPIFKIIKILGANVHENQNISQDANHIRE